MVHIIFVTGTHTICDDIILPQIANMLQKDPVLRPSADEIYNVRLLQLMMRFQSEEDSAIFSEDEQDDRSQARLVGHVNGWAESCDHRVISWAESCDHVIGWSESCDHVIGWDGSCDHVIESCDHVIGWDGSCDHVIESCDHVIGWNGSYDHHVIGWTVSQLL